MTTEVYQAHQAKLSSIRELLNSGTLKQVARSLNSLSGSELAYLLESAPSTEREILWGLIEDQLGGEVLVHLSDEISTSLIKRMDTAELLAAAENLDLDDLADLIQELPDTITAKVLNSLDQQRRTSLEAVLSYDEDTAGGLMNTDIVPVRPEVSIDVALRFLRRLGDKLPTDTDSLIVVNRDMAYLGTVALARLVSSDPTDIIAEVMSLDFKPMSVDMKANEVASQFEHYDYFSAPVIDADNKVVGRITVDDVVDVIREEGEHQFMGQAGLSEDEDMFAPVIASVSRRALWLGVNLITALIASWIIGLFQGTIEKVVALAVLMPIVANMGGIAGIQTMTLAIRGIALGQLSSSNMGGLISKEVLVGLINSLIWSSIVALVAWVWFDDISIAWLIAAAMVINLIIAAISGAVIPVLLNKLGVDPALAGGVFLTTVTDIIGFLSFLGLASVFLL